MIREHCDLDRGRPYRLLSWRRNFAEVEVLPSPGNSQRIAANFSQWHYHRAIELTLILRGRGQRFVADHVEAFSDGDLVLIGENIPHYWMARGECSGLSLQWHLPQDHGLWNFADAESLRVLTTSRGRGRVVGGATAQEVRVLLAELVQLTGSARLAQVLRLLARLARAPALELRPLASSRFTFPPDIGAQEGVYRAMSYIVAHHREPVHLRELLRLTGLSRPTFARQFRRHAGCSFSEFLNRARLQSVCRELRESSASIGGIAFDHGFNHLSFFNRLFRRELGISPSGYRSGLDPNHPRPWVDDLFTGLAP